MRIPVLLVCLLSSIAMRGAHASVQVLPNGRGARPLLPKSLDLRTRVAGGFASTTATWIFSNSSPNQIEAEFIAEAPLDAVVTGFAYWFKEEKVVARIVEKARAAEIYRGVVQRRRDPALVEMIERNFFRARISPVEAKADLRLEITWVQPLTFKQGALLLQLPLRRDNEELNLERWNTTVEIAAMPQLTAVETTKIGEAVRTAGGFKVTATGTTNLPETLEVRLKSARNQTWPALAVTSPSGSTPYFAILRARGPKIVTGRTVWDTRALRAADGFVTIGRGVLPSGTVAYNLPGAAEKLWAARTIDDLGRDPKRREETMRLSRRYGLPSRWTSWLAIPAAERARLRTIIEREKIEQASRNLSLLGNQLAADLAAGRQNTRAYKSMKRQYAENARIVGDAGDTSIERFYRNKLWLLRSQLEYSADEYARKRTPQRLRQMRSTTVQMQRLAREISDKKADGLLSEMWRTQRRAFERVQAAKDSELLVSAISSGRIPVALRQKVEKRFAAQFKRDRDSDSSLVERLASEWAKAKAEPKPNAQRIAALRQQTERLVELQGKGYHKTVAERKASYLSQAEYNHFSSRLYELGGQLSAEILAKRENGPRAKDLTEKLQAITSRLEYPRESTVRFQPAIESLITTLLGQRNSFQPDTAKIAATEAELARLKQFSDKAGYDYDVKRAEDNWQSYSGSNYISRQWYDAVYGKNPNPKAAEFYATKLQTLLDEKLEADKKRTSWDHYQRQLASTVLQQTETQWLSSTADGVIAELIREMGAPQPNAAIIAERRNQLDAIQQRTIYNKDTLDTWLKARHYLLFQNVLENLRTERNKPQPDKATIASLEERVLQYQEADPYYHSWGSTGRKPQDPREFGKLRIERIAVRAEHEKIKAQLQKTPAATALREQEIRLARRENELMVRMGDPLIAVVAPANCRQVIAILPSGEIKKLLFNAASKQWEARFDVPAYAPEGAYVIKVLIVGPDGVRQRLQMSFQVDLTAPQGVGTAVAQDGGWNLKVQCGPATDRVEALLPWGARADLKRGTGGIFETHVMAPPDWKTSAKVQLILTDRAHNRTEIHLDLTQ